MILLSLLTRRWHVFDSANDSHSLAEIAQLLGLSSTFATRANDATPSPAATAAAASVPPSQEGASSGVSTGAGTRSVAGPGDFDGKGGLLQGPPASHAYIGCVTLPFARALTHF